MKKITLVICVLVLLMNSCKGNENDSANFIFKNKNQKIELKILNGNDYLIKDTPTKVDFVLTNIDPKTTSIIGLGIRMLGSDNGITKTEINVPQNHLKTDILDVQVRFKEGDKYIIAKFSIPIRN